MYESKGREDYGKLPPVTGRKIERASIDRYKAKTVERCIELLIA